MLAVRELRSGYGNKEVLHGVSLDLPQGSLVTLLGANGAGKTTLLSTITGIIGATAGSIAYQGRPLANKTPDRTAKAGILLVPERRELFLQMKVEDNIRLGGYLRRRQAGLHHDLERILEIFPRLRERLRQLAQTLSGGEQQMLAIARALMARPQVLLLDEPSLGLAPKMVEEIFAVIRNINDLGTSILLVEQNAQLALDAAQYCYVLELGEIVFQGTPEDLLASRAVRAAFL
jgi:branched-chain amino acid transport system ATP-binding protein